MTLQIRITDPDGTNSVILDQTPERRVFDTLNSSDEGVNFRVAKNHAKSEILNPDNGGYTKLWEVWDTVTNERLNYGPITEIGEDGPYWSVVGAGRSALLNDYIDSRKTFYASIDSFIDDLRFENIAIEPKTTTLAASSDTTANEETVFGTITPDEKYEGLSLNTKDNVIDSQVKFRPGEIERPNTYYSVDSYWAGMSVNDAIIVDLGEPFPIDRIDLFFPWWGGIQRRNNRTYDFTLAYADDVETPITTVQERDFGPFHEIFDTGSNSKRDGDWSFNLGTKNAATRFDFGTDIAQDQEGPVSIRYLRVNISDVHAWYGGEWGVGGSAASDWDKQCNPDEDGGISEDIEIDDRELKPNNDCYASVLEVQASKEIIGRDRVKPLALQRIDNNNLQITYFHVPAASETKTTDNGFRKFEPGGTFRKVKVTYSGAGTTYNKFFNKDCANCYPDGFNFGVVDQNNSLIHSEDASSGTDITVKPPVYTRKILMKGSSNAVVTQADAWRSRYDPLSWGAQYSFTEIQDDWAALHFRGQSLRWYATVPEGKTGATVKLDIRNKDNNGEWTSWTTLESSYKIPDNIQAEIAYEITYESGYLLEDTVYEFRITNLDGNFASIDSFEGYWSGSLTHYNDDSSRVFVSRPEHHTQIYDGRFSFGTMTKWNKYSFVRFAFTGDRAVLLSAKGRHHGIASVYLYNYSGYSFFGSQDSNVVPIPGGEPDGSLEVDLGTGKRGKEVPQFVLFDSNEYFPDGLPWGRYGIVLVLRNSNIETYLADIYDTNNFVSRCQDCKTSKGTVEINKYIYFDSILVHEKSGLSVAFDTETHLDMLKSVTEAIQSEWDITDNGIVLDPRIGVDTKEILREGQNTLVDYKIVNDVTKVASMLISSGADIDGLPLSTVTEDRKNRQTLGRTVMRREDFRNMADYHQLIGLSRTELKKRRYPEKRITVTHIADNLSLNKGDTFLLYTKKMGALKVRIMRKEISENNSGRTYSLECMRWPIIA